VSTDATTNTAKFTTAADPQKLDAAQPPARPLASQPQNRLPENPADCDDRELALTLWRAKVAKDAAGAHGFTRLKDACADMAKRAPLCDPFRTTVISTLLRCAVDHLGERHRETIEPIFFEAFPEEAADDPTSENAELDAAAVGIDGCNETAAEIARLAKLSLVDYDREHSDAAKRLGVRASTLAGPHPELLVTTLPRPTPQTIVEAVMWTVRERGLPALLESANQQRLLSCDATARAQINQRIEGLIAAGASSAR
jgi:hypothetical protein